MGCVEEACLPSHTQANKVVFLLLYTRRRIETASPGVSPAKSGLVAEMRILNFRSRRPKLPTFFVFPILLQMVLLLSSAPPLLRRASSRLQL